MIAICFQQTFIIYSCLNRPQIKNYIGFTPQKIWRVKKTQKGHTTENSGKKFHIQKNPGNFVFFEFLIYLRENIRCYYHSIVLNSNSVVLWDSEDSFPESFIIKNLYQSIMGFFSIWNDVALIFLDSFFLSFDILFLYTIVEYHKNALYSFLLVLLSGWISTNNCAVDFNPLASIMIWLTKEVLSLPNSLCVTSPAYSNCSCSILNSKIMADFLDLGIQVSPMFTSVVQIVNLSFNELEQSPVQGSLPAILQVLDLSHKKIKMFPQNTFNWWFVISWNIKH